MGMGRLNPHSLSLFLGLLLVVVLILTVLTIVPSLWECWGSCGLELVGSGVMPVADRAWTLDRSIGREVARLCQ